MPIRNWDFGNRNGKETLIPKKLRDGMELTAFEENHGSNKGVSFFVSRRKWLLEKINRLKQYFGIQAEVLAKWIKKQGAVVIMGQTAVDKYWLVEKGTAIRYNVKPIFHTGFSTVDIGQFADNPSPINLKPLSSNFQNSHQLHRNATTFLNQTYGNQNPTKPTNAGMGGISSTTSTLYEHYDNLSVQFEGYESRKSSQTNGIV